MKTRVTKLPCPERAGDEHDRPLRWAVITGAELQKFCTRKDAELYARLRRRAESELAAIRDYLDATWC